MKQYSTEELTEMIREAGFRATKTRLLVLSFLSKAKYPVSIKQIAKSLQSKDIDQVTIYRILDAFKKTGLVSQVDFQHGHAYFELKDTAHDHHHIVCTSCKKIEDFTGCDYSALMQKALSQTKQFSEVTNHSLELFGICKTCSKDAL